MPEAALGYIAANGSSSHTPAQLRLDPGAAPRLTAFMHDRETAEALNRSQPVWGVFDEIGRVALFGPRDAGWRSGLDFAVADFDLDLVVSGNGPPESLDEPRFDGVIAELPSLEACMMDRSAQKYSRTEGRFEVAWRQVEFTLDTTDGLGVRFYTATDASSGFTHSSVETRFMVEATSTSRMNVTDVIDRVLAPLRRFVGLCATAPVDWGEISLFSSTEDSSDSTPAGSHTPLHYQLYSAWCGAPAPRSRDAGLQFTALADRGADLTAAFERSRHLYSASQFFVDRFVEVELSESIQVRFLNAASAIEGVADALDLVTAEDERRSKEYEDSRNRAIAQLTGADRQFVRRKLPPQRPDRLASVLARLAEHCGAELPSGWSVDVAGRRNRLAHGTHVDDRECGESLAQLRMLSRTLRTWTLTTDLPWKDSSPH